MDKKTAELLAAAKELDAIYGYWWDLADGSGIVLSEGGIKKFEKVHARLQKVIKAMEKSSV